MKISKILKKTYRTVKALWRYIVSFGDDHVSRKARRAANAINKIHSINWKERSYSGWWYRARRVVA